MSRQRTSPVEITVEIERIGEGGLIAVGSAHITIKGVALTVHGFEVRRGDDGRLRIDAPGVVYDGVCRAAVELPADIEQAVGRAISAALR